MKLSELYEQVREHERQLAPGQTALLGDWLERMRQIAGGKLPHDRGEWDQVEIPDNEAAWWLRAYQLYAASGDQYESLQDLYDRISILRGNQPGGSGGEIVMKKEYLGDSVYATYDGYYIWLTTENGEPTDPSNQIALEPRVLAALSNYAERAGVLERT